MSRRSNLAVMARLSRLVRPLAGFMALAVAAGLAGNLAATAIMVLGGVALLDVLGLGLPLPLASVFASMAVCAVVRGALRYGEQAANHYIAFKLLALVRDKVFGALRRLAPAKLAGRDKGDLVALVTSDVELLEVFYAHTISPVAIAVLFCAVMTGFIGSMNGWLALVAAVSYLVVGALVPWAFSRLVGSLGDAQRAGTGELGAYVLDSLRGLSETVQFGDGASRLAGIEERTEALVAKEGALKLRAGLDAAVTNTVIVAASVTMAVTAAGLATSGAIAPGDALVATLAMMGSFGPCVALANLGASLAPTFAAGSRILDLLDEEPVLSDVEGMERRGFSGAALRRVEFAYDQEPVLRRASVAVRPGEILGVVGPSGSGKSTMLQLLMRFWEPDAGRVEVSGTDVGQINTRNLRELEAYMTQETHLFCDSVRSNLLVARPDATDAQIEAACRKASVWDFIQSLPDGLDTPVGELGDTLSGGERQRIGLARAFLHGAPLLLLDEPTSNLDALNEAVVLKALAAERAERSVVLVTHRPSTVRAADRVVRVANGKVA
ncbi:ABC transporter ATP-binding protein [Atopobiaceae bacterium 24-176]